jgi:hypothetical protein
MKKAIVTLACTLLVPLAFAQTSSTGKGHKGQGATTTEPITVTGTIIKTETEAGAGTAASYQPFKTLVVNVDGSNNNPRRYVLNATGSVVNKAGEAVRTPIKPGSHVRVYYMNTGNSRVVDHVVVE